MAYLGTAPARSPLSSTQLAADLTLTDSLTVTGASDGGDTATTINNSAGSGSTDETVSLIFLHAGSAGGKIVSTREGDYSGSSNNYSRMQFHITRAASDVLAMQFDSATDAVATFLGGETANANSAGGLTINQQARDDEVLAFKSSDVAHGLTSETETDTWATFKKVDAVAGGVHIKGYKEGNYGTNAVKIDGFADGAGLSATQTTSGSGGITLQYNGHNESNAIENLNANGVVFAVRGNTIGGAIRTLFMVDEDGDVLVDGSTSLTAFDAWDDAALLRSLELWRDSETEGELSDQMLKSRYDANKYTKEQLGLAKLIQVVEDEDWARTGPDANQSLVNTGAIGRITTGAIWQNHEMLDAIIETMEERDAGFTAALKKKFEARGLPTQILDWTGDIPADLKKPDVAPAAFNAE